MIDLQTISIGIGIITTLIGFGWKLGKCLGEIKSSVVRIETLLAATITRIDRIEVEVKDIDRRLREHEHKS